MSSSLRVLLAPLLLPWASPPLKPCGAGHVRAYQLHHARVGSALTARSCTAKRHGSWRSAMPPAASPGRRDRRNALVEDAAHASINRWALSTPALVPVVGGCDERPVLVRRAADL